MVERYVHIVEVDGSIPSGLTQVLVGIQTWSLFYDNDIIHSWTGGLGLDD